MRPPLSIAVIGSGYMGGGIAQVLAMAGHCVRIADASAELARESRKRLILEAQSFESAGHFPPGSADVVERGISAAASIAEAVADVAYVEEAVPERVDLKHATLRAISSAARPEAVIGSNTSTISIGTLAEAVEHPERFLGVHFSNPAPFIPGVELIPHSTTTEQALQLAEDVVRSTHKSPARVTDVAGFVLNRLQYALLTEANRLVDEGVASVADVDTIARTTFGFRLPFFGPFAIADMAGLDVYRLCYQQLEDAYGDRFSVPPALDALVSQGHLGAKGGGGYYPSSTDISDELVEYRTRAYAHMARLLEELGPSPLPSP